MMTLKSWYLQFQAPEGEEKTSASCASLKAAVIWQEKAIAHHSRQQQQDDGHLHYVCHSAFCSKAVGGFNIAEGPKGCQIEQQM